MSLTPEAQRQKRLRPLQDGPAGALRIHEIYASVQGESTHAGRPCVFVRTTACHLRCGYCDTAHAFNHGSWMTPDAIMEKVLSFGLPLVELTGGEPLLQAGIFPLMSAMCDCGLQVLLETSGSLPIESVDPRVCRIVDMKTPSSGEVSSNRYENLKDLRPHDEVKFVIGDRTDYLWSRVLMETYEISSRCTVLMGTVFGKLAEKDLAAWMVEDTVPARMQIQMHKYIWEPDRRGV